MNLQAFNWGRCLADNTAKVIEQLNLTPEPEPTLDEIIGLRMNALTDYQDQRLADHYLAMINKLRHCESNLGNGEKLSLLAAEQYARLLMIKGRV